MDKVYKVAIIGGGASGLLCAVELLFGKNSVKGEDIVILEKTDRIGKKLIATGNGQGNLFNSNFSSEFYHGEKNFIGEFISNARDINIEDYLYNMGIPTTIGEDGKAYPLSKQASSVLDRIRDFLIGKGVIIITDFCVTDLKKGKIFSISNGEKTVNSEFTVLAVGGSCGKQFGTDGSSYSLAENLGHKTTKLYPSLVQLKTETTDIKGLKGLKESARVTAFDGIKPLKSVSGDILFTDFGISGSAVFAVSGYLAGKTKPSLLIEFLPELSTEQTEKILSDKLKNSVCSSFEDILSGVINKRIGKAVLATSKSKKIPDVVYALKNFKLKVTGNLGFNYAQVTKGGIETADIHAKTFESKLCHRLFITGEVLDIDGDCGGYNLTFAFVSGIVAGKTIKDYEKYSNKI